MTQLSPAAFQLRLAYIVGLGLTAAVGIYAFQPAPWHQALAYHDFADQSPWLGISHFANVVSNIPYVAVGVLGIWFLLSPQASRPDGSVRTRPEWWSFLCLFLGIGLTGFGSTYYHLAPTNERLVWDRLPMAIAFMGLFADTIAERISQRAGGMLLLPLELVGVVSVWYWHVADDLRPYILVQFYPLLAIPLILLLFPPRYTRTADLFVTLGWYGVAKLFETWDGPIYTWTGFISGHTLKHLVSALGAYWLVRMLRLRKPIQDGTATA